MNIFRKGKVYKESLWWRARDRTGYTACFDSWQEAMDWVLGR
jgi:hypothetical protein